MERTYLGAVIEARGTYGIMFPDVPGVISGGDSREELAAMAREALELQLEGLFEQGEPLPEPTQFTIEEVARDLNHPDDPLPDGERWAFVMPVVVTLPPYPNVVNVAVEADVVHQVDHVTTNRRAFITEATRRELERLKKSA